MWLAVALVGLIALGVSAWQVTARSHTLDHGAFGGAARGGTSYVAADYEEIRHPFQAGARHVIAFSVHNPGPLPVRVTGIPDESLIYDIEKVLVADAAAVERSRCFCEESATAFAPLDVGAGEDLLIFLHITLEERPWEACGRAWFKTIPVRFSVLGTGRQQRVPLGYAMGFQVPGTDCTVVGTSSYYEN